MKEAVLRSVKRAGGKKSDRRRVWHFMERECRPRKRRDPEPRSVVDFTNNNTSPSPSSRLIHPSIHHQHTSAAILVRARSDQLTMGSGLICGAQAMATASAASSNVVGGADESVVPSHLKKSLGTNFLRSVVVGSSLGFCLRPHKRRDSEPRRDRQSGNKKKTCVALRLTGRTEYGLHESLCTRPGQSSRLWTCPRHRNSVIFFDRILLQPSGRAAGQQRCTRSVHP